MRHSANLMFLVLVIMITSCFQASYSQAPARPPASNLLPSPQGAAHHTSWKDEVNRQLKECLSGEFKGNDPQCLRRIEEIYKNRLSTTRHSTVESFFEDMNIFLRNQRLTDPNCDRLLRLVNECIRLRLELEYPKKPDQGGAVASNPAPPTALPLPAPALGTPVDETWKSKVTDLVDPCLVLRSRLRATPECLQKIKDHLREVIDKHRFPDAGSFLDYMNKNANVPICKGITYGMIIPCFEPELSKLQKPAELPKPQQPPVSTGTPRTPPQPITGRRADTPAGQAAKSPATPSGKPGNILEGLDSLVRPAIRAVAKATGRATGHIADIVLENFSGVLQSFEIPAFEIPASADFQGYVVPHPIEVTLPDEGSATVPLEGYCTDIFKNPVPAGTEMPPVESWVTGTQLTEIVHQAYWTITELQGLGAISTPFHAQPENEVQQVLQQFTWYYTAHSPSSPFTIEDLCERLHTRLTDGALPEQMPNISYGVSQILDAVWRTGAIMGIPSFLPSPIPDAALEPDQMPPSGYPDVERSIKVSGTGRTTGHIADITVSNPTPDPLRIIFGPGSNDPAGQGSSGQPQPGSGPIFIPASGDFQPYLVPSIPAIDLQPGETSTVPVEGYCVDIYRPPVPSGNPMPGPGQWVAVPPSVPVPPVDPDHQADPSVPQVVNIPTQLSLAMPEVMDYLENMRPPVFGTSTLPSEKPCFDFIYTSQPTIPGTDIPIPVYGGVAFSPDDHAGLMVPILAEAITRISHTYDEQRSKGLVKTPFSQRGEREQEAVIQQTFWIYSAKLTGEPYDKGDFVDNTIRQFEQRMSRSFEEASPAQQEQVMEGADDFWDAFEAVGAEAKVISRPPSMPSPDEAPAPSPVFDDFDSGAMKGEFTPDQVPAPGLPSDVMVATPHERKPKCECGTISFRLRKALGSIAEITSTAGSSTTNIDAGILTFDEVMDATYVLEVNNIHVECPCDDSGHCIFYPRNSDFASVDEDKVTLSSSTHVINGSNITAKDPPSVPLSELRLTVHAWCKGDDCEAAKNCRHTFVIGLRK